MDGATPSVLDAHAVQKLLDTLNSGLIPSLVRYKNNKDFVTLDNDVNVAKGTAILNGKTRFDSACKLNVLFPVITLFVNVSDPKSLKKELEHRNMRLRGFIHSFNVDFTKQHSMEGHVNCFFALNRPETIFFSLVKPPFWEVITQWILITK